MQFDYSIHDELGIHARPASLLVRAASKYPCDFALRLGDKSSDMRGIFSVMKLGVRCGDTVTVVCSGDRAEEAIAEVREIFEMNL